MSGHDCRLDAMAARSRSLPRGEADAARPRLAKARPDCGSDAALHHVTGSRAAAGDLHLTPDGIVPASWYARDEDRPGSGPLTACGGARVRNTRVSRRLLSCSHTALARVATCTVQRSASIPQDLFVWNDRHYFVSRTFYLCVTPAIPIARSAPTQEAGRARARGRARTRSYTSESPNSSMGSSA